MGVETGLVGGNIFPPYEGAFRDPPFPQGPVRCGMTGRNVKRTEIILVFFKKEKYNKKDHT